MGVSMAAFTTFIEQFSDVLWNSLLLFLLVGTGVYFTVRLRGVQVRRFGEGFRRVFGGFTLRGKKADAEGMSSFQALTTAIAAQVGTGNITGCATALVSGGPGALFWTWVSAFFGMATIYAEAVLAQHYKTTVNGQVTGGPAYYIRAAFKGKVGKVLATVFSVLIILALGFMGNMVQSNSIGDAFHNAFGLNRLAVGRRGGGHCGVHLPGRRAENCRCNGKSRADHGGILHSGLHRHSGHQRQGAARRAGAGVCAGV